jgi:hypothetical protein
VADRDERAPGPEPADADELYQLAPHEFVAARNALARRLRAAGERGQAAEVAKRRRPPPTAWALNQVARHQPNVIEDFLAAGEKLRTSMEQAVRGDASGLRAARAGERDAIGAAVTAALVRLGSATDAMIRRLTGTLHAAIVDDAVARQLRAGTLDKDHEAPGLGLPGAELVADAPSPPPAERSADREEAERRRRARARRAELEASAERLERRAQRLRAVAAEASARAAEAGKEADEAEASAEAARRQLVGDTEHPSG